MNPDRRNTEFSHRGHREQFPEDGRPGVAPSVFLWRKCANPLWALYCNPPEFAQLDK